MPVDRKPGFLVRMNVDTGYCEVWTGSGWAGVPPEALDDQCLTVGGIRITVAESERISSTDAGKRITMIPNHEYN